MTQEKLDALQRVGDTLSHMITHYIGVSLIIIASVIVLFGIADLIDEAAFSAPVCKVLLFLAGLFGLGIYLL
jgi:hypothetical protein